MDSREVPQQQPPQQPNMMVGPSSYPSSMPTANINPNSGPMMGGPNPGRFPFNVVAQQQQQQQQQQPASKPQMDSLSPSPYDGSLRPCGSGGAFNIDSSSASAAKKKRGRPRKYSPDGNIALGLTPTQIPSSASAAPGTHGESSGTMSSEPPAKKNRGRPPGSGKKQLDALGAGGVGFTPHVIMVQAGEVCDFVDVKSKL
ncbi:hypothetical protein TB2_022523 [Malus domestica]